jgi:hypothetical protein
MVGKVIGKGGETIEKTRQVTGCDCQMDQATKLYGFSIPEALMLKLSEIIINVILMI